MIMLNTIAARGTGGDGFAWTPYRVKLDPDPANRQDMLSILAFERANDTLRSASHGSDPHGWRNALNAYGWGQDAMTDPARRVYDDREYRTFGGAVRAAVKSIARYSMPVGILGWAGGHAQVMTGYVVTGADPARLGRVHRAGRLPDRSAAPEPHASTARSASRRSGPGRCGPGSRPTARPTARSTTRGRPGTAPQLGGARAWAVGVVPPLGDHPADPRGPARGGSDAEPVARPDPTPTPDPTASQDPTPTPAAQAGAIPSPTEAPTPAPTEAPTPTTEAPTPTPTEAPTPAPTEAPTPEPATPAPDPTPTPDPAVNGPDVSAGDQPAP